VGLAPVEYLLRWRTAVAKDALRYSRSSLEEIAHQANIRRCRLRHDPRRFVLAARLTGGRIFGAG